MFVTYNKCSDEHKYRQKKTFKQTYENWSQNSETDFMAHQWHTKTSYTGIIIKRNRWVAHLFLNKLHRE
jgi:hypothetical protein